MGLTIPFDMSVLVVLFGPPGCGKGTQADYLSDNVIGTGRILRKLVRQGGTLAAQVRTAMKAGGLACDQIVEREVYPRLGHLPRNTISVLDGYPRNEEQASKLLAWLDMHPEVIPIAIEIQVPYGTCLNRIIEVRVAEQQKAREAAIEAGDPLPEVREDDNKTTAQERMRTYEDVTVPGMRLVQSRIDIPYLEVDGQPLPEDVGADIVFRLATLDILQREAVTA